MPALSIALETEGSSDTSGKEEHGWIAASRDGDHQAFGRLVSLHQHRVFRLSGRFFRRREDVEDVAQETFLTAWDKLGSYRQEAPFEHWLTRICLNQCFGRLRRQRAQEEPFSFDPEAPSSDPDARLEVAQWLGRLAPEDRFILLLLDGQGWSTQEIADRLGWSRANVKVRAHRARARLRRLLEKETVS